jgi:hypothetical protein
VAFRLADKHRTDPAAVIRHHGHSTAIGNSSTAFDDSSSVENDSS